MRQTLPLAIPIPAEAPDSWLEYSVEFVDELTPVMDLAVGDDQANIIGGSVPVEDVHVDAEGILIEFIFDWSSCYGCEDMKNAGTENGTIRGTTQGSAWILETLIQPSRSTYEKF